MTETTTSSAGPLEQSSPPGVSAEDNGAAQVKSPALTSADANFDDAGSECEEQPAPESVKYQASIYQAGAISPDLGIALSELEAALGMPVWLLIQNGPLHYEFSLITETIADRLLLHREELESKQPIAVVIDSLGGDARGAYRIATTLQKHSGGFIAIIPRMAKSAATMLAFGADQILLGEYGELGPLDVQIQEEPGEYPDSALNEVEAVQRLHIDVLTAMDQTVLMLMSRMLKRPEVILPHAIELVTQTMRPLLEKVDTKLYTKRSRQLKVGEDYAARLLARRYPQAVARAIAQSFVNNYSDHSFLIDAEEAAQVVREAQKAVGESITPLTAPLNPQLCHILNRLRPMMEGITAVGLFREVEARNDPSAQD